MDSVQVGQARHNSYVLFSRLLREGVTPELLPFVQQIPELAASLTNFYDEDIAAAQYETIFGFNLFSLQSIFLDVRSLAGGKEAKRVQKFYNEVGFIEEKGVDSDHIAQLLLCLAQLCQSEAKTARQQQANLLGQHLLRWLLPFTGALKQQGQNFYVCVADLLLALVADHARDLADELIRQRPYSLPAVPDLLGNKKNGWKEIAAFLLTPAYTGIYLGRDNIASLAKQFRLPRGFGERQQILVNLFQSAIVYDGFADVMTGLMTTTAVFQTHYGYSAANFPGDAALASQWQDRAAQTTDLLTKLHALVA